MQLNSVLQGRHGLNTTIFIQILYECLSKYIQQLAPIAACASDDHGELSPFLTVGQFLHVLNQRYQVKADDLITLMKMSNEQSSVRPPVVELIRHHMKPATYAAAAAAGPAANNLIIAEGSDQMAPGKAPAGPIIHLDLPRPCDMPILEQMEEL